MNVMHGLGSRKDNVLIDDLLVDENKLVNENGKGPACVTDEMDILEYCQFDSLGRGEVWVSQDRKSVEWIINDTCVRRFAFTSDDNMVNEKGTHAEEDDRTVVKAGFVDFERVSDCFVIILKEIAYIYYLSNGNSTTVCFPFPIANAFFYSQGILLERNLNPMLHDLNDKDLLEYRFITLTDPLSPFGGVSFTSSKYNNTNNSATIDNSHDRNIITMSHNFDILSFPADRNHSITVMFNKFEKQVYFYYTKINSTSKKINNLIEDSSTTTHNSGNYGKLAPSNNLNKAINFDINNSRNNLINTISKNRNLRKTSILNRRTTSGNELLIDNIESNGIDLNQNNHNIHHSNNTNNIKRSLSATIDRMSSVNSSNNRNFTPTTPLTTNSQQEQNSKLLLSKDISLVEISSITLPSYTNNDNIILKCIPLIFNGNEAIVIFDTVSKFCKIWLINMKPEIINSTAFKVYGNTPPNLIRLLNIDSLGNLIDNIYPIINSNNDNKNVSLHENSIILKYQGVSNGYAFYNPFLKLVSPLCHLREPYQNINNIHNSKHPTLIKYTINNSFFLRLISTIKYPSECLTKRCFNALVLICPDSMYFVLIYLWQYIDNKTLNMNNLPNNKGPFKELRILLSLLKTLIYSCVDIQFNEEISNNVTDAPLFKHLLSEGEKAKTMLILSKIVMGLHLIREEFSLNVLCQTEVSYLDQFLSFAVHMMNWSQLWKLYYKDNSKVNKIIHMEKAKSFARPLDEPPSIMKSLYSITDGSDIPITPFISFSKLVESPSEIDLLITPRSFKLLRLYELIHTRDFVNDFMLDLLTKLDISSTEIDTFPIGIRTPIRKILQAVENRIVEPKPNINLKLISRPDIERSMIIMNKKRFISNNIEIKKEFINILSSSGEMKTKTINSKPRDIYSIITEIIKKTANLRDLTKKDGSKLAKSSTSESMANMKKNVDFIFSNDQRYKHILSLLDGKSAHKINFVTVETEYSKILAKKKIFAKIITLRTLASGIGRAAVNYSMEQPLTSQKWHISPLNFTTLFNDGSKITTQIDDFDSNTIGWGEFHNGVAFALKIAKDTQGITGGWISLNKPKVLNATHGGFLLGMGLSGHLKDLEEWHVYNYLSPKETFTSIGLLLGMSASARGTKDFKLVKVLAIHIVALLPRGSSDLNINISVQTAGLIGMGMLYQECQDRKLNESLLLEMTSFVKNGEELVANEGYRMAVGIAIGLNNLGSGYENEENIYETESLSDNNRVFVPAGKTTDTDTFDFPSLDSNNTTCDYDKEVVAKLLKIINLRIEKEMTWIPDNSQIGALIALMLIFLKSNNNAIASQIRLSISQRETSRPELCMYRELTFYMINWNLIEENIAFVLNDVSLELLSSDMNSDNLPIYYTLAGRILSIGIKYASTGGISVRNLLISLLDRFLPFYQYNRKEHTADFELTIKGISVLVNAILISLSMIMCATGDIEVLRRIKYLHEVITGKDSDIYKTENSNKAELSGNGQSSDNRQMDFLNGVLSSSSDNVPEPDDADSESDEENNFYHDPSAKDDKNIDNENHYGKYISTNMALGFLFLGSGQYALQTSNLESLAYLILSVLPTYMRPYPLQELKHFWSMAVEPRCLVIKDALTEKIINGVSVEITVKESDGNEENTKEFKTPCLLPDIRTISKLSVDTNNYYPLLFTFNEKFKATDFFQNGMVVYMQPKDNTEESVTSSKDLETVLARKIEEIDTQEDQGNSKMFAQNLFKSLGINDISMVELKGLLARNDDNDFQSSDPHNLEMLCSNERSGDVIDYQLELWKSRQKHVR